MRINSSETIAFTANRTAKNTSLIEKSLLRLGSGLKIAKGSENASGLAISETMRAQIKGISQSQRNMQDGLSLLETSNEGLNNVNDLLQRARELAVMTATDTLTFNDRQVNQMELDQILEGINDTAGKLEFNTKRILGSTDSIKLQVGGNAGQHMTLDAINVNTEALNLDGISLILREGAENMITTVDDAIKKVTSFLTKVGSDMQAIEHHLSNAKVFEVNLSKSLSLLEDTDMAAEMMNFVGLDIRQKGDHLLIQSVNKNFQDVLNLLSK